MHQISNLLLTAVMHTTLALTLHVPPVAAPYLLAGIPHDATGSQLQRTKNANLTFEGCWQAGVYLHMLATSKPSSMMSYCRMTGMGFKENLYIILAASGMLKHGPQCLHSRNARLFLL